MLDLIKKDKRKRRHRPKIKKSMTADNSKFTEMTKNFKLGNESEQQNKPSSN